MSAGMMMVGTDAGASCVVSTTQELDPKDHEKVADIRTLSATSGDLVATADVLADLGRAREAASKADAPNTVRAYQSDWRDWAAYAESAGLDEYPITPEALAAYIGALDRRGLSVATIRRRMTTIARVHRDRGGESPTEDRRVRAVLRGLAREKGSAPKNRKAALPAEVVAASMQNEHVSMRDRAILALGLVTSLRRSEIVGLDWSDIEETDEGLAVTVRRSKTDQAGQGRVVAIPATAERWAVDALTAWREASGGEGPVFRCSGRTVARAVQRAARRAGLDPQRYGAHSLRAGMITTASRRGVSLPEVMLGSGHRSVTVAASYVRDQDALRNRAHRAVVDAVGEHLRR